jgi:Flp pilus assembly protein TadD
MRMNLSPIALALTIIAGPGWAETAGQPETTLAPQPPAQENAGGYLAARTALMDGSFRDAAYWFERALRDDPENFALVEGMLLSAMSLGDYDRAAQATERAAEMGFDSQFGTLALAARDARGGNFAAIRQRQEGGAKVNPVFDELAKAWSLAGEGQMTEAIAQFDALSKQSVGGALGLYHKALALAVVGDFEGAEAVFASDEAKPLRQFRRAVIAHAEVLSQLERNEDALGLLTEVFNPGQDLAVEAMKARLQNDETLSWTVVRTPQEGFAEIFYSMMTALRGEADANYTLLYARAATYINPGHAEALLTTASMLVDRGQGQLAAEVYAQVPPDAPEHYLAEVGRADTLMAAGKPDAALEVMQTLSKTYPGLRSVHVAYGDMLRKEEKCEGAVRAYEQAIDLIKTPVTGDWGLYFLRAICHEKLDNHAEAEADLRQALSLKPDEPQALNFLGYSFLEQGRNFDEALDMIKRAVDAAPDNGAIVDSLAWAYFRLGRYDEALEPMERASLMEPVEPEVTDHLGDVYWAVGRKLEARFQWRRALSFNPEEDAAARIRRKLEIGLDNVLTEEGAPPLSPVNAAANDN